MHRGVLAPAAPRCHWPTFFTTLSLSGAWSNRVSKASRSETGKHTPCSAHQGCWKPCAWLPRESLVDSYPKIPVCVCPHVTHISEQAGLGLVLSLHFYTTVAQCSHGPKVFLTFSGHFLSKYKTVFVNFQDYCSGRAEVKGA